LPTFRNLLSVPSSKAGCTVWSIPRRTYTILRTRRKSEIKMWFLFFKFPHILYDHVDPLLWQSSLHYVLLLCLIRNISAMMSTSELPIIAIYSRAPVSTDSVYVVYRGPKKKWKIKQTVHKFQNVRQARTSRNMVKSSSPNAPST
jgi:hypothetical protein